MRIIGSSSCIALGAVNVLNTGVWQLWYLAVLALAVIYPHAIRIISIQVDRRTKLEMRASLIDAFVIGTTIYVMGFSAIPTLALMTIGLANGMALGGIYFLFVTIGSIATSLLIPTLLYGFNYDPKNILLLNIISATMLLVYFMMFALVAYKRAVLLQKSRSDLRQQKAIVEIEKKKSENLLHALMPHSIATKLESEQSAEPCYHESTTVLIADIIDFDKATDTLNPKQLVDELNYCYKAFDQIVLRNNLEPLRTSGGAYISVAGAPVSSGTHAIDAIKAAIEMQRFCIEYSANHQLKGDTAFKFRFVIHTGPLISGLITTRKFSFDVWGATVRTAIKIKQKAEPNDILISQDTLSATVEKQLNVSAFGAVSIDKENSLPVFILNELVANEDV